MWEKIGNIVQEEDSNKRFTSVQYEKIKNAQINQKTRAIQSIDKLYDDLVHKDFSIEFFGNEARLNFVNCLGKVYGKSYKLSKSMDFYPYTDTQVALISSISIFTILFV